ncbi:hypothetical protein QBC46DRAFT_249300 [Diplogelasinospora grovesii]|uniref:F-box domain-containing protein n=1 Tax=Diplogelasinospora grovesii TaxID=303347 RepID=A0AAN6NH06_9PEZI|nr:hypothetical protein QBC46DRAFT_249300 [Diplogelasinospora grovesii]
MQQLSLPDLPDDVQILVLSNLESARDIRAVSLACRSLHRHVQEEGWRAFVLSRFPTLSIPAPSNTDTRGREWQKRAESLTFQSRCWDRRSFEALATLDRRAGGVGWRDHVLRVPFRPAIDAHADADTREELVVWGAGDDIVARWRTMSSTRKTRASWHQLVGTEHGDQPGRGDVIAIKLVKHMQGGSGLAMIAGRNNGELSLLSAEPGPGFGKRLARFAPGSPGGDDDVNPAEPRPVQDTINSLDLQRHGGRKEGMIAAATNTSIFLYEPPPEKHDQVSEVAPSTAYDLKEHVFDSESAQLRNAVWMGRGDVLALALKGCKHQLRYLAVTPSGEWAPHTAAKNLRVKREFGIKSKSLCPNSLAPVRQQGSSTGGTSLLLSAWGDGTCRLQDLRTPSPFDAVYHDNTDPAAQMEALMTYGSERFVGGGLGAPTVKIFDFRWTKGYYHSSGLPCSDRSPFPEPEQPFLKKTTGDWANSRTRCDHMLGLRCRWHDLSRHIYYRPNANLLLGKPLIKAETGRWRRYGVCSLGKASDMSPNFYIGIAGGVIEAQLETREDWKAVIDPNFGFGDFRSSLITYRSDQDPANALNYKSLYLIKSDTPTIETGDGYAYPQRDRTVQPPLQWPPWVPREGNPAYLCDIHPESRRRHRLDPHFQFSHEYRAEDHLLPSSPENDDGET